MATNYNDDRLVAVKKEEELTLNKNNTMYNSMIKDTEDTYKAQIDATKEWADKQSQLQQEKTDFAIEKIEQQKEQANKDYQKEQSGAYVDWQKESNRYGANAETMAANGFVASGYGESSQVSMFNQYQNRVATAREVFNKAILNYNNSIQEAKLQNNSVLAEIAYNTFQKELELALQSLQNKNALLEAQANKQLEIKNMYHNKYQDVLDQINKENALAEEIRQYNESLAEEKRQFNESMAEQKRQYNASMSARSSGGSGGSGGSGYSSSKSSKDQNTKAAVLYDTYGKYGTSGGSKEVNTAYYQGSKNPDCKNGTFSNGYQPDNVNGKKLKKTGDTITIETQTLYGQKQKVVQNVWKTSDGTKYYWEGRQNKYIKL